MIRTSEAIICDPDLLFSSRIEAAAAKAGFSTKTATSVEELLAELKKARPRIVFLNLDAAEGKVASLRRDIDVEFKIVGYYSHVNTRLEKEAERLGFDHILSRGAFVSRLGEMLRELGSTG